MERRFICAIDKHKNVSLNSDPIPIKYLPEETKVFNSLMYPSIKEGNCSVAWKFVDFHCENGSSQIHFEAHAESFRINIDIADMHRLAAMI